MDIENIQNIVMSEIKTSKRIDNEITTVNEWLLETDGTNLLQIFGNEFVDYRRTVSNDITKSVKDFKSGLVEIRNDKDGNLASTIGRKSFSSETSASFRKVILWGKGLP